MVNPEIFIETNNLLLHAFILFTALVVLFLALFSKIEIKTISSQINSNFTPAVTSKLQELNNEQLKLSLIRNKSRLQKAERDTQTESINTTTNNYYLTIIMFLGIVGFTVTILLSWLSMKLSIEFSITKLLVKNLVLFLFIALFELYFFFTTIIKFAPITDTEFKQIIYDSL